MPDVVTDQTSAHDALRGYVPNGLTLDAAAALRAADPDGYVARSVASMTTHVRAMLAMQARGAVAFDYGNNIRAQAVARRRGAGLRHPRLRARVHPPALLRGQGTVPLGRAVAAIPPTSRPPTRSRSRCSRTTRRCAAGSASPRERVAFQGLPARIFWLGYGERARFGLAINDLVRRGVVSAPIVIGRDHLDTGSVASPNRETEGMRDGSDAIADWPVLNALLNTSCGATWVSVHHGGGVGIGYSLHAGMVIVADGTAEADEKLQRVLTADPGIGVVRHADAGYPEAIETADAHGRRHADAPRRRRRRDPRRSVSSSRSSTTRVVFIVGDCGAGRTTALLVGARAARRARTVHRRRARGDDARAVPARRRRRDRRSCCPAASCRRSRRRPRDAFDAVLNFFSAAQTREGDARRLPARRCARPADVRGLPGPEAGLARTARGHRAEPQPVRAGVALRAPGRTSCCTTPTRDMPVLVVRRLDARRRSPRRIESSHRGIAAAGVTTADTARTVHALTGGRAGVRRGDARGACDARRAKARAIPWRAGRAALARRAASSRVPVLLRVPAAPGARLRRAQGHPQHPRARGTAHADAHRATAAAHAGIHEGLPALARGRGPRPLRTQALHADRSAAARVDSPERQADAARRRGHRARGAPLRGRAPVGTGRRAPSAAVAATAAARGGRDPVRRRADAPSRAWGIIEID